MLHEIELRGIIMFRIFHSQGVSMTAPISSVVEVLVHKYLWLCKIASQKGRSDRGTKAKILRFILNLEAMKNERRRTYKNAVFQKAHRFPIDYEPPSISPDVQHYYETLISEIK
jgi:hypothetical protein